MNQFLHEVKQVSDVFTVGLSMQLLGLFCIVMLIIIMFSAQRDKKNKIDFAYLLVEPSVGNITLGKFGGLVALIASTWIVIYQTVNGDLDAATFFAYLTAWAAVKIAADITGKPKAGESVESTTERTTIVNKGAAVADAAAGFVGDDDAKQLAPKIEQGDVGKSVVIEPPKKGKK